jgi:hypothetical protein
MDIGTIAVSVFAGAGIGFATASLFAGSKISDLYATVREQAEVILGHKNANRDLTAELTATGESLTGLRSENATLQRDLGAARAEVVRLKPLADRGEQAIAGQLKASKAGHAARAAQRAADAATNVESIGKRKRAKA